MKKCPKCGAPLRERTNIGITVEECSACGYLHNTATGEEKMLDLNSKTFIVKCPSCAGKLRVHGDAANPVLYIGDLVNCSYCNTDFYIPEKPDPELFLNITCSQCSGKSKIPANKGRLSVTCPHCKTKYIHDTGTWPEINPAARQSYGAAYTQSAQTNAQAAANTNECYQCPKCGWTHPNTSTLNESIATHTQCQSCGNAYLVHLTWDD